MFRVSSGPSLSKTVWDKSDFDTMSWHENAVHAIAFEPLPTQPGRLLVDLDYIVGGVCPVPPSKTSIFWVCPATLVFDDASGLTCDIDMRGWGFQRPSWASSGPDRTSMAVSSGRSPGGGACSTSPFLLPTSRSTCVDPLYKRPAHGCR